MPLYAEWPVSYLPESATDSHRLHNVREDTESPTISGHLVCAGQKPQVAGASDIQDKAERQRKWDKSGVTRAVTSGGHGFPEAASTSATTSCLYQPRHPPGECDHHAASPPRCPRTTRQPIPHRLDHHPHTLRFCHQHAMITSLMYNIIRGPRPLDKIRIFRSQQCPVRVPPQVSAFDFHGGPLITACSML